jgi:hypothetical protein
MATRQISSECVCASVCVVSVVTRDASKLLVQIVNVLVMWRRGNEVMTMGVNRDVVVLVLSN